MSDNVLRVATTKFEVTPTVDYQAHVLVSACSASQPEYLLPISVEGFDVWQRETVYLGGVLAVDN